MSDIYAAKLTVDDISEDDEFNFSACITEQLVDFFAEYSGDFSPLHMSSEFAQERGFEGRVAHGGIFMLFFSRAVGMLIPGENALLQSVKLSFLSPVYPPADINFNIVVTTVSAATKTIVLKGTAQDSESNIYCRALIQVGFTSKLSKS
ncbi:MaoC/PaaZ C-terminal domain-containing protein [Maridesulfovibrio sp.]|uniref:MaoC/PaaZ C-terminal domain-containing protein n=1 Tax=Maridesulfovibrio sp. TaxID=2795000 RepID=UPI002A18A728|nr:MaoC/PaaZ C-terminal domain-containing protein [Maridesulfovibrio sp.]